jgi:hypothetical protein
MAKKKEMKKETKHHEKKEMMKGKMPMKKKGCK